jgi:hypothetical protein
MPVPPRASVAVAVGLAGAVPNLAVARAGGPLRGADGGVRAVAAAPAGADAREDSRERRAEPRVLRGQLVQTRRVLRLERARQQLHARKRPRVPVSGCPGAGLPAADVRAAGQRDLA